MEKVIIRQNRDMLKKTLTASAVMIAISIVCFFFEGSFYRVAAIAGTVFFGICFIYVLKLYLNPKMLLVIDKNGIRDVSTFKKLGVIPWGNITDVKIVELDERKYLSIVCNNMEDTIKSLPADQEKLVYRNLKNNLEPISIMVDMADRRPEEIKILIKNYL